MKNLILLSILFFSLVTHAASYQAVIVNQTPWYVDATMDGANPSLGVANVSSYTEIIDAGLTLKPQTGSQAVGVMCSTTNAATTPSTGNTVCAAGSESLGINFSVPAAGAYEVCFYGAHYIQVNTAVALNAGFELIETPTSAQTLTLEGGSRMLSSHIGETIATGSLSTVSHPLSNCSIFNWSAAGIHGVRLMFEQSIVGTPTASLMIMDAGASYGQPNSRWTVKPITQSMPMPLLVGSVTSATTGLEKIERAYIANNGSTCVVSSQSGSWMTTPCTRGGTGNLTMAMTGFSAAPACTCSAFDNSGVRYCEILSNSSTSLNVATINSAGSTADAYVNIICMGPK